MPRLRKSCAATLYCRAMAKQIRDLTAPEILALAISLEEEDSRIYGEFADGLRERYPQSAQVFDQMQKEETEYHARLLDIFRQRYGPHIPLIRRQDVKGFVHRRPVWRVRPLGLDVVRKQAATMELETRRFYERAIERISDTTIRKLLGELASTERQHYALATTLEEQLLTPDARSAEDAAARQLFVLQIVQPGLAGLMDGSGRRSLLSSPRPSRPGAATTRSSSASRPRLAPASRWGSPRRSQTMAS